jgi:restriction system protein
MGGQEFEVATGELFKRQGYSIEHTPASNDGGIDLILVKGDERIGVQCKAYGKNVGVASVRELHGVKSQWSNLNSFTLVALHGFSKQAKEFAHNHNIKLFSIERDYFHLG